jgi:hypothetical protein
LLRPRVSAGGRGGQQSFAPAQFGLGLGAPRAHVQGVQRLCRLGHRPRKIARAGRDVSLSRDRMAQEMLGEHERVTCAWTFVAGGSRRQQQD